MARRQNTPVPLGGMYASGDPATTPNGTLPKLKNVFVRPDRIEKRPGWLRDSSPPSGASFFFKLVNESSPADVLGVLSGNGTAANARYRTSGGTWTDTGGGAVNHSGCDYTNFLGRVWIAGASTSNKSYSFDGTTFTGTPALQHNIDPATICTFVRRLFIGNLRYNVSNILTTNACEFDTAWTAAGGMSVANASGVRTATITNGSTDSLTLTTAVSSGTYSHVVWQQHIKGVDATAEIPLTLSITDSAGTTTYASAEVILQNATDNSNWTQVLVEGDVPAGTSIKLKINAGNSSVATSPLKSFRVADSNYDSVKKQYYGALLTSGRFVYDRINNISGGALSEPLPHRIYFSDTDDPTRWRSYSWVDCKEVAGPVTTLRAVNGRLYAFKKNATWAYRPTADANVPIVFDQLYDSFGCVGPMAMAIFENKMYFVGEGEIFEWDGDGAPRPLAGDGMRETLFAQTTKVTTPLVEIDSDNRELWVYLQPGKIHIYNLVRGTWSYITLTDAADAELTVSDLIYIKPSGESSREMWAIAAATGDIIRLRSSQTQDNITGTSRDVVAEIVLRPVQTQSPRSEVTVEELGLLHKITSTQTGSTFEVDISRDDGVTYGNSNTVTVSPLSTGEVLRSPIPVCQTAPRLTLRLKHTGLAGPTYFNVYGADLWVQRRGGEIPKDTPSAVSNTL